MIAVKPNGVTELQTAHTPAPAIETIVDTEKDMARSSSPLPPQSFGQRIGPSAILALAGLAGGALVTWGIAQEKISNLRSEVKSAQIDIKVLQRAQADADAERAAVRQWMIDHGVKLATPSNPPTINQPQQEDQ